ncbi:MAG: type III-B CRISPR module-associated Cmr3 family protein, partial [Nautiliaceae bacterium]
FDELDIPKIDKISGDIFKIYLLTPAIFRNGWYPDFLDENFEGKINEVRIKLIAASLGKNEYIGGWDIRKNSPKPMYKAVPVGSVYYFKILEGNKEDILEIDNIVSNEEYKKHGFGKMIIADYKGQK